MILDPKTEKPFASSYGGSDRFSPALRSWAPMLTPPDEDVLGDWEQSVGRMRELINENGLTSGAVQSHLDNVIGPGLKLVPKPDYRALGLSAEWAVEFDEQVSRAWNAWAEDPDRRCHAAEVLDFTGLIQQGYRSYLMSGEILASAEWINRPGWFKTSIQPIDPERLSNPAGMPETVRMRAGVEKSASGAPVAYHIREGHPYDQIGRGRRYRWKRIPRNTSFGRRLMIHIFAQQRPGQTRGQTGMKAGIRQVKMMERWQTSSLEAAIINSMYAAVIESSLDHPAVLEALSPGGESDPVTEYLTNALEFHEGTSKIKWDGSKIAHLFPGEKLSMMKSEQPVAAFEQFESAALRNLAASWNMSYEQLSRDYSKTNYSSARAAMLEAWKFIIGQRETIAARYANEIYTLFLEEAIDSGRIELPRGAPSWYDQGAKGAYSRAAWIGPGREQIDPLKASKATELELSLNLTTLEKECASRGFDYRDLIEQRGKEVAALKAAGLPVSSDPAALEETLDDEDPDD